eukprot:scpid21374/ scgid1094/ Protein VPRBP; DDB1- and CUL4-associated factor 1; HIV-1 Vpr-binding protein; Vpr-interacting protein
MDSDSDSSSDGVEEPFEVETVDLLTRLSDTLDDFTADGGDVESVSDLLNRLSEIVLKYSVEYEKRQPDPYDQRHIERAMPDSPLAKVVKKIETDPDLMGKIIESVILHGGEEESKAGAHYLALVIPLVDMEEMVIQLEDVDGLEDFLFAQALQINRNDRELPLYCLRILSHMLESKPQTQTYKTKLRELTTPLMKRCHELHTGMMRRLLRKQAPPGDLMGDYPLPKRSRSSGVGAGSSGPQPVMLSATHASSNGGSSHCASNADPTSAIPGLIPASRHPKSEVPMSQPSGTVSAESERGSTSADGMPPLVPLTTTPAPALRPTTPTTPSASSSTSSQRADSDVSQRGIPAALASGLASPQVTAAELSADDCLRHDIALHPMTESAEFRIIASALVAIGYMQEVQGIFLPYALKTQMVSSLVNISSVFAQRKRWLLVIDCLKLVSQLVAHKKFALELVSSGGVGVQLLLGLPPGSSASAGVMNVFSSLAENNRDTMERIYLILQSNSNALLDKLVGYCVQVLECGHASARSTSGTFLMHSFNWPAVKECFDKHDGLRKLLNQVTTLSMMSNDDADVIDEEAQLVERQRVRDTLLTLQNYILANFTIVTKNLIGMVCQNLPSSSVAQEPLRKHLLKVAYQLKDAIYASKLTLDNVSTFLLYWPALTKWSFVGSFMQLGGVQLLLQFTCIASKWKNTPLRLDIALYSLEGIAILALLQADVRLAMCESFLMPDGSSHSAMSLLLEAAEGSLIDDPSVQTLALQILATCVSPDVAADHLLFVAGHDHTVRCGENYSSKLSRVWSCVRHHQGIRVLVQLIQKRTPAAAADSLRGLACIALSGLSRCGEVKQILSKLPLFNSGQMLTLMADPIAPTKLIEHRVFCHFAQIMINNVAGKAATDAGDSSLSSLQRSYVVGQTDITFPRQELLQIIYRHLVDEGLPTAALALQMEAKLPPAPVVLAKSVPSTPNVPKHQTPVASHGPLRKRSAASQPGSSIKPGRSASVSASPVIRPIVTPSSAAAASQNIRVGDNRRKEPLTVFIPPLSASATQEDSAQSLDKIVTHFLRDQHLKCAHPMGICPPFSLTKGHQCPVPQFRRHAPVSIAQRLQRRQLTGGGCGIGLGSSAYNRQFIYSRYRPAAACPQSLDTFYSAVAFMPDDEHLLLGCNSGEICLCVVPKDRQTATIDESFGCHHHQSHITNLVPSKSGRLLLSSASTSGPGQTILWSLDPPKTITFKQSFENVITAEFANRSEDRFIATYPDSAKVHDTETGAIIYELADSADGRHASFNFASFHPSDDLVLSSGCLWDVRGPSVRSIRQFDSLNSFGCGLFHPKSGVEVIINSEIVSSPLLGHVGCVCWLGFVCVCVG